MWQTQRFASTQSPAEAPLSTGASTQPTIPYEGVTSAEWDALLQQASGVEAPVVQEHVGWLKELGLDFGWGPTAMMQTLLENVHFYTGLPWWASIAVATLTVRAVVFPLYLRSTDTSARMAAVRPLTKELQPKMLEARMAGDRLKQAQLTQELQGVYRAAGIKMSTIFMPMVVQVPFGFGMFRLVRNMAELPVPGMDASGVLWFMDLTVSDPFFILPAATAGLMYLAFKVCGLSPLPLAPIQSAPSADQGFPTAWR